MFANPFASLKQRRVCLIYQNNNLKVLWDLQITFLLLFICAIMPYHMAFKAQHDSLIWCISYYLIDVFFLIDLILMFFTTIPETDRLIEITERKKIANNYLTGWFIIDFCSIIPFDMIMKSFAVGHLSVCETETCFNENIDNGNASSANIMLRAPKITKAFRAVRLLRMVKVFKLMKKR